MTSTSGSLTGEGASPGWRGHLDRVAEERRRGRDARELLGELAVDEMQRAMPDEPAGRGVPERGRTAVAEHDLVAVGKCEQLAQTVADPPDDGPYRSLPVRRPHQVVAGGETRERLGADLGRPAPETPVAGLEICWYLQCIDHCHNERLSTRSGSESGPAASSAAPTGASTGARAMLDARIRPASARPRWRSPRGLDVTFRRGGSHHFRLAPSIPSVTPNRRRRAGSPWPDHPRRTS